MSATNLRTNGNTIAGVLHHHIPAAICYITHDDEATVFKGKVQFDFKTGEYIIKCMLNTLGKVI